MSRKFFNKAICATVIMLLSAVIARSQTSVSSTPYSSFGIGDILNKGTAYNRSMGGVGVAGRDHLYINILNPAAVTARDSLSFMADFSLYSDNKIFRQGDMRSASNTFNIGDLAVSFPLWYKTAFMAGITPYSGSHFGYSYDIDDPNIIGHTGNISYTAIGSGGLYNVFAAFGADLFKGFSLGVQMDYYFGNTQKQYYETFTSSSYNGAKNGYNISLNGIGAKLGVQYKAPVGTRSSLIFGATVSSPVKLRGEVEGYKYSTGTAAVDTIFYKKDTLGVSVASPTLPLEFSVGVAFKNGEKFMVEADYTRSCWKASGFDRIPGFMGNSSTATGMSSFSTTVQQSIRLGMEYTPNKYDVRYFFRRCTYRAGAFYRSDYYKLDGHGVNSFGLSAGMTLPVFGGYNGRCPNGLTIGVELGQRGSVVNNLIRERFISFSIGVNIFDIWFQQPRYE